MRIHYFDNLRSTLLLMGVFYHASLVFSTHQAWIVNDTQQSTLLTLLSGFLHSFRMPLFYLISGFFLGQLYDRHGLDFTRLFKRLYRLVVPLVTVMFTVNLLLFFVLREIRPGLTFANYNMVSHLWFLITLVLFVLTTPLLYVLTTRFSGLHQRLLARPLTMLVLSALACVVLALVAAGGSKISGKVLPSFLSWYNYFAYLGYFSIGFLVYRSLPGYIEALSRSKALLGLLMVGALGLFALTEYIALVLPEDAGAVVKVVEHSSKAVLAICIGLLFLTWFGKAYDTPSPFMARLSDASYTVYLFHQFGVVCTALAVIAFLPNLPAGAKYLIIVLPAIVVPYLIHIGLIARVPLLLFLFNGKTKPPAAGVRAPATAA